jgi:hypothetical protein
MSLYLIFERDDPGLNNFEGVVRNGFSDRIFLKFAQVGSHFRQQLPRNDETHIFVDDGLNEGLEAVHEVVFAKEKNSLENGSVLFGEVAMGTS